MHRHLAMILMLSASTYGAELVLPQNRTAYYCSETIELAIADLALGDTAAVELRPTRGEQQPLKFEVRGDGGAVTCRLAPLALAPDTYQVTIDGAAQRETVTVSRGLHSSTMYVSQTGGKRDTGANFILANAFGFGLFDDGLPTDNPRRRSPVMASYDRHIQDDIPAINYMYWTGYVLHKPWGIHKEWCSREMTVNMRLFNFHVAQRMRRYAPNLLLTGALDEPGLPWGRTPAGGAATGFPGWDTAYWYEDRGWHYTDDPAAGSDEDWMTYMSIRCAMLGEQLGQAAKDIKRVAPELRFGSDLYAPQAIMDGTDPWNQRVNDIPTTHVFVDWGYGKLGGLGGLYLEKAHDPTAKVSHAMNGQLFGSRVPLPAHRQAYHLMLNTLLAGGLHSNWWLNHRPLGKEDFIAVNGPAERLGPVFHEMSCAGHDTAVLWSFSEIAMRLKDITRREAGKQSGEQIRMMIAEMPESVDGEITVNGYNIGGNYKGEVLTAWQAINRAGYPAHIVHEKLLPQGQLKHYKTLVIIGQTFPLPAAVLEAIAAFVSRGGKLIVDPKTSIKLPDAIVTAATFADQGHKWGALFKQLQSNTDPQRARDLSYYQTNYFQDSFARDQVAAIKATMQETDSLPVMSTDSVWLGCERHVGGDGEMHMLINAYEVLPELDATTQHVPWNYAGYTATVSLSRIPAGRIVYVIEGLDWQQVRQLSTPQPMAMTFEPGEMKLFLVAPRQPEGLDLAVSGVNGLRVQAKLRQLAMPWPLHVSVSDPDGNEIVSLWRATDAAGQYAEEIPIGSNAAAGAYRIRVTSPVGELTSETTVAYAGQTPAPEILTDDVRVFDQAAIVAHLQSKPAVTVVFSNAGQQALAEQLVGDLRDRGLQAKSGAEADVWHKARYPRVWDPYLTIHHPAADQPLPDGETVQLQLTIESEFYGTPKVQQTDGSDYAGNWRSPGTLLTVAGDGFIDITGPEAFYEAGCKLFVNAKKRLQVVNGEAETVPCTEDVKQRWARPWQKLIRHNGAHNLTPELPEAYAADEHLILLGDSKSSELVRALQASELLLQVVDDKYPGPGKALLSFAWSPFGLEKNVILIGASNELGLRKGAARLLMLAL